MINRTHYRFELILIIITALFALLYKGLYIMLLLWMIPLGVMQVVHSAFLANYYFSHPPVRTILIIYWIITFGYLMVFIQAFKGGGSDFIFPVLPLLISLIPFLLTVFYKKPRHATNSSWDFELQQSGDKNLVA